MTDDTQDDELQAFLRQQDPDPEALDALPAGDPIDTESLLHDVEQKGKRYFWGVYGPLLVILAWGLVKLVQALLWSPRPHF